MSDKRSPSGATPMAHGFDDANAAAVFILAKTKLRPKIAVILGSGLGKLGDELSEPVVVPYAQIPRFPVSTAAGQAGELVIGKFGGVALAVMKGRAHLYDGYTAQQVAFPVRVLGCMGVATLIVTNAAGGINLDYGQGRLVLMRDHINLQGQNPLLGPNDASFGPRFPDMTNAYSRELRKIAQEEAARQGPLVPEGVRR